MRKLLNPDELTSFELAKFLGVTRHTILRWCRQGDIPEPRRRGIKRIWSRAEAEALKERVRP